MSFREKICANAQKYISEEYARMGDHEKIGLFKSTAKLIYNEAVKNGIKISYNDQKFVLPIKRSLKRSFGMKIERFDIADCDTAGVLEYGRKRIPYTINKNSLQNGKAMFKLIVHETCHLLQEEAILCYKQHDDASIASQYVDLLKANIIEMPPDCAYHLFGIEIDGAAYVSARSNGAGAFGDVIDAFYHLMLVERYAVGMSESCCQIAYGDYETWSDSRNKYARVIRDKYGCHDLSDKDICLLLDKLQGKIYHGIEPSDKMEARIMYDIAVALSYTHNRIDYLTCQKLASENEAWAAIAEYDMTRDKSLSKRMFELDDMTHDVDPINALNINMVGALSTGRKANNPSLIIHAIYYYGARAANLTVNEKEMLKLWCWSDKNNLEDEFLSKAAKFLGPDFAPEICREKIAEAKEALERESRLTQEINIDSLVGPLNVEPHDYVEYIELGDQLDGYQQRSDQSCDDRQR